MSNPATASSSSAPARSASSPRRWRASRAPKSPSSGSSVTSIASKSRSSYGCETLTAGVEDWARAVDGLGCDGVIDAAGISATLQTAINLVRPNGWISKVGWGRSPCGFSLDPLVQKNITLRGSFSHNWPIWERVIRLLATGALDVTKIVGGSLAARRLAHRVRGNALRSNRQSRPSAMIPVTYFSSPLSPPHPTIPFSGPICD